MMIPLVPAIVQEFQAHSFLELGREVALKVMASGSKSAMMRLPGTVNVVPALNRERTGLTSTETSETVCEQLETAVQRRHRGL